MHLKTLTLRQFKELKEAVVSISVKFLCTKVLGYLDPSFPHFVW